MVLSNRSFLSSCSLRIPVAVCMRARVLMCVRTADFHASVGDIELSRLPHALGPQGGDAGF